MATIIFDFLNTAPPVVAAAPTGVALKDILTLPDGLPTDQELSWMDREPPGLFAQNQNSVYGLVRKIVSGKLQEQVDLLAKFYVEGSILTTLDYLPDWESQLGLPTAPSGKTIQERRNLVAQRFRKGPMTFESTAAVVESFIKVTYGAAISLLPGGLTLGAGVPLYAGFDESTDLASLYQIIPSPSTLSYDVRISNALSYDSVRLGRELARLTPAGLSYTLTSVAISANLIVNPGLETNTLTDHHSYNASGGFDATVFHTGARSWKSVAPVNSGQLSGWLSAGTHALTSGQKLSFTAWVLAPEGAVMQMMVVGPSNDYKQRMFLGTGTWRRVRLSHTAAATGNYQFQLQTPDQTGITFWLDDICVTTS